MKKFLTPQVIIFCFSTKLCHFLIFEIPYLFLPDFDTDETDEEDENKEYVEETNRDVAAIAACKLVTSDVVPKVLAKCINIAAGNILVLNHQ